MAAVTGAEATTRQRQEIVGRHLRRLDSRQKVDGSIAYTDDLPFEGFYAELVRSSVPHGEIVSIDTEAAEAVPGVRAVVTGQDLDEADWISPFMGQVYHDQPLLAIGKTRYSGEPVAAVVAESKDAAQVAAPKVRVEYNRLPTVEDVREARNPDAPRLHETSTSSKFFDDVQGMAPSGEPNDVYTYLFDTGDVEAGFAEADLVVERTYSTPMVQHSHLEPYVAIADYDPATNSLVVTTGNQVPHFLRREIARIFFLPESKVTVKIPQVGGSYGSKLYARIEPLAAALSRIVEAPVKLRLNASESFDTAVRDGSVTRVKTGVTNEGRIVAEEIEILWDTGAYAEVGPRKTKKAGYTAPGPYNIENLSIASKCTYTNKPPAVPYRGFGVPQTAWATETQLDIIADELGVDPYQLRALNAMDDDGTYNGAPIGRSGIPAVVEAVGEALEEPLEPPEEAHLARGRGISMTLKSTLSPSNSEAIALLNSDGSLNVVVASAKVGQGSHTTMAQIAADALGVDIGSVAVNPVDTSIAPFDTSSTSSRSTFHMGNAVVRAVDEIQEQVFDAVAADRGVSHGDLNIVDGAVVLPGGEEISLGDVMRHAFIGGGGTFVGRGQFSSDETGPGYFTMDGMVERGEYGSAFWMSGASIADVTVDTRTGSYTIDRLVNICDAGRSIDPERVRGQVLGAALHALGHTRSEEMVFEAGQQVNKSLLEYKIPSIHDMPARLEEVIIESGDPNGPYGAKGVGETNSSTVSPAVGNAIADAVGVRILDLPITPERVLRGIRDQGGDAA